MMDKAMDAMGPIKRPGVGRGIGIRMRPPVSDENVVTPKTVCASRGIRGRRFQGCTDADKENVQSTEHRDGAKELHTAGEQQSVFRRADRRRFTSYAEYRGNAGQPSSTAVDKAVADAQNTELTQAISADCARPEMPKTSRLSIIFPKDFVQNPCEHANGSSEPRAHDEADPRISKKMKVSVGYSRGRQTFEGSLLCFTMTAAKKLFPGFVHKAKEGAVYEMDLPQALGFLLIAEAFRIMEACGYAEYEVTDILHLLLEHLTRWETRQFIQFCARMETDPETVAQTVAPAGMILVHSAAPSFYPIAEPVSEWIGVLLYHGRYEAAMRIAATIGLPGVALVIFRQFCLREKTDANFIGGATARHWQLSVWHLVKRYMRNANFMETESERRKQSSEQSCPYDNEVADALYPDIVLSDDCEEIMDFFEVDGHVRHHHIAKKTKYAERLVECVHCGGYLLSHHSIVGNLALKVEHEIKCIALSPRFLAEWYFRDRAYATSKYRAQMMEFEPTRVRLPVDYKRPQPISNLFKMGRPMPHMRIECLDEKELLILWRERLRSAITLHPTVSIQPPLPGSSHVDTGETPYVVLSHNLVREFMRSTAGNTRKNVETLGHLYGHRVGNTAKRVVTHVLVPNQEGTDTTCKEVDSAVCANYAITHNLSSLGWIHVHPAQSAFLSSVDLHMQLGFQTLEQAAIAIVVAPTAKETKQFRLTDVGMKVLAECDRGLGFHFHQSGALLSEEMIMLTEPGLSVQIIDFRLP